MERLYDADPLGVLVRVPDPDKVVVIVHEGVIVTDTELEELSVELCVTDELREYDVDIEYDSLPLPLVEEDNVMVAVALGWGDSLIVPEDVTDEEGVGVFVLVDEPDVEMEKDTVKDVLPENESEPLGLLVTAADSDAEGDPEILRETLLVEDAEVEYVTL